MSRQTYNARACGARCDECVLRGRVVVPPEGPGRHGGATSFVAESPAKIAVVGDFPADEEVQERRPQVGPSGSGILTPDLAAAGMPRGRVWLSNSLLCLDGNSLVRRADGSTRMIREIVLTRDPTPVLSVAANGELVARPVIGWHRSPRDGRSLLKLWTEDGKGAKDGRHVGPILTADHPVLTRRGYVPVGELDLAHDWVATGDVELDSRGFSAVEGSLLGDGGFARSTRALTVAHAARYKDYAEQKARVLARLGGRVRESRTNQQWHLVVDASRWIARVAARHYRANGSRCVPPDVRLDTLAFAMWFLDDGYLFVRKNHYPTIEFHQTKWSPSDIGALIEAMRRDLDIDAVPIRGGRSIYINPEDTRRVSEIVAPFTPPSMRYKLVADVEARVAFDPTLWAPAGATACWARPRVEPVSSRSRNTVFCIDVAGTHNFATVDAVVHNCQPFDNNLEYTIREANKRGLLDPLTACRPRLLRELANFAYVIPVGGNATKAVLPKVRAGILSIWGSHVEVPESLEIIENEAFASCARRVLPTVSPAFVARRASMRPKFQRDLAKALRWFRGKLNWVEPLRTFCPTPKQLREWLAVPSPFWSWDLESPWHERRLQDPLRCGIERFGIADATGDRAICVPFLHIGGGTDIYTWRKERGQRERPPFPYNAHQLSELRKILEDFLLDPKRPKVGWNSGYFDTLVTEAAWGVVPVRHIDAIGVHHNIEPELPHSLGFAGSVYTDVHSWKLDAEGAKLATGANTDEEKCEYCMTDCAVTSRVFTAIHEIAKKRGRLPTIRVEARIQAEVCRELHKVGMPLDRRDKIRFKWDKVYDENGKVCGSKRAPLNALAWKEHLTEQAVRWLRAARQSLVTDDVELRGILDEDVAQFATKLDSADFWKDDPLGALEGRYDPDRPRSAGYDGQTEGTEAQVFDASDVLRRAGIEGDSPMLKFNPGSPNQLRSILFDQWGMTIPTTVPRKVGYTSSGEPSTGDAVLIAMLCDRGLQPSRRAFLEAVRGYRKAIKLRGTYVKGALIDFDQGGYWWEDGRMRSTWNSHVTGPGRLSSSGPNAQNIRALLRTMYRARRGRIMGGADASQIHLRIIAARWGVARLLECFEQDGDPHAVAALAAFGDRFKNAPGWPKGSDPARGIVGKGPGAKWSDKAKEYRQIAKILQYAAAYGADAKTIHQVLLSTEDNDGNLTNLEMDIDEVRLYHREWKASMPEFERGWETEMNHWKAHGYVEEPVTGRRCWFTDGEDFNAIVNWPILASEAAIMHLATLRLVEQIPFGKWGPGTGLINQCHDSLTVETLDTLDGKLVREVADTVAWAIAQPVPAYSQVRFTADPCWGHTWADA